MVFLRQLAIPSVITLFMFPLEGTESTGKVLLDQLVTIDFNARDYRYVEDIQEDLLDELLARVKVLFEKG